MMDGNYSLSDIRAATGGDNGFGMGNDSLIWLVVLFLFLGGGAGFGGNRGFGNAATAAAQQEILLGQQFEGVHNKLDSIGKGICDSTYAVTNAVTSEGRAMQSQLANCCCDTRLGIAGLEAKIDQQTGVFTNMLKDAENQRLRDRIGSLELKDAMCGVVRYPMQMSYASNCNPFCPPQNCGYGCGYQANI